MKKYDPVIYGSEDLVNYLSAKLAPHRISRAVIKEMIDAESEFIRLILLGGDKVFLNGVGTFRLGYIPPKPERDMFNPACLIYPEQPEVIHKEATEEYNVVRFKSAKSFKEELINETYGDAYHSDYEEEEVELDGEKTISE